MLRSDVALVGGQVALLPAGAVGWALGISGAWAPGKHCGCVAGVHRHPAAASHPWRQIPGGAQRMIPMSFCIGRDTRHLELTLKGPLYIELSGGGLLSSLTYEDPAASKHVASGQSYYQQGAGSSEEYCCKQ